ncbi:hypothetical protein [uncultured Proteiniphilum sp.]|uniref:hypothetical protein n=1 Tax=uncultured Proteiniphilum sp. TaxID=497637 RepID=UPI002617B370|nr:hypothetical protein [uncultured Proteiniphilum sp.]
MTGSRLGLLHRTAPRTGSSGSLAEPPTLVDHYTVVTLVVPQVEYSTPGFPILLHIPPL